MGKVKIECLFLASAVVVVAVLLLHSQQAAAAAAAAESSSDHVAMHKEMLCKGDLKKLVTSCKKCIKKGTEQVDPPAPCCHTVQTIDLLCICQSIPPRFEKKIDMQKLAYVAEKCEKPIPIGTKCGSQAVPII